MRQILIIVVVGALAYFGWGYYQDHKGSISASSIVNSIPFIGKSDEQPAPAESEHGEPPPFVSKVKVVEPPPDAPAGAKATAPPGFFYITDRVSVETKTGVIAVVPGDLVKLLERKSDGKVRVTNDLADFELKQEQVTQDPEVAQVAEKKDYNKRYHINE